METRRFFSLLFGALALLCASSEAQTTSRVSIGSGGEQGDGASSVGGISADGLHVVFASDATTLAPGDSNGTADAFERDIGSGLTALASSGLGGAPANGRSYAGSISSDGRYQVFASDASNLVPGDTSAYTDVFVRDRWTGVLERISVDSDEVQADGPSYVPASVPLISSDGRYAVFSSYAFILAPDDWNETSNVFLRDRQTGVTTLVSADTSGAPAGLSDGASISADGRYVAFQSEASNLVAGDANGTMDIFVRDLQSGTTTLASVSTRGVQGSGFYGSISPDGRYVGFVSYGSNLVPGDTGVLANVFLRDLQTGETTRVSVSSDGVQGDGHSVFYIPSISFGGRCVAFGSAAANLVPGDTNGAIDVFVHDRATGVTARVSVDSGGAQGNGDSYYPSLSADGRYVAFQSSAGNLVADDTNGTFNVFVHDRGPASAFTPFCSGVGCPCGNDGIDGHGCDNAQATGGVSLGATGDPELNTVVLHGAGFPGAAFPTVLVIRSLGSQDPPVVFGDGLRCISTAGLVRLGATTASAGSSTHPLSHGAGAGAFFYQLWYRNNPASFCDPAAAFNLSGGLSIAWP